MSDESFRAFGAQLTRILGELDLAFERTTTPDGMRLWNVPFTVENDSRVVTLYLVQGWVVALHALGPFPPKDGLAETLLRINANMFGAKAALNADYVHVLADCRASLLSGEMVWTMLRAVVFGAQQLKGALTPAEISRDA